MRRSVIGAVVAAMAVTACSSDGSTTVDPVDPTPAASATPSAEPSPSTTAPAAAAPDFGIPPLEGRYPGGQPAPPPGQTTIDDLPVITPEQFATGLVAVDTATGAVSWFNGLGWSTFDVDAALDAYGWATDDLGGLLVQAANRAIWHLEAETDEPTLVVPAPRDDFSIVQRLVGGGWHDGSRHAYVELGMTRTPETASTDLVAVDIDDGQETVLIQGVAGWESGVDQASVADGYVVLTMYAESFGIAWAQDLTSGAIIELIEDDLVTISTAIDVPDFGPPAAWALVQDGLEPGVLLRRDLDGSGRTRVDNLPVHTDGWASFTSLAGRQVATAYDGAAIARLSEFEDWRRLELPDDVTGRVRIAPGFALG